MNEMLVKKESELADNLKNLENELENTKKDLAEKAIYLKDMQIKEV